MNRREACECAGKHPHKTQRSAQLQASRGQRKGAKIETYRCGTCGFYHVGKQLRNVSLVQRDGRVYLRRNKKGKFIESEGGNLPASLDPLSIAGEEGDM